MEARHARGGGAAGAARTIRRSRRRREAILRAEGLLQQARAATRPNVNATFSNVVVDTERGFDGAITQPRSQSTLSANLRVPVLAASRWAATTQARDQIDIANLSTADVRTRHRAWRRRRPISRSSRRSGRSKSTCVRAKPRVAHLDYAQRRLRGGAGTRLNELRAAQEVATDEARLENARLASGARRKRSAC